jgi:hypothetical protein
VAAHKQQRVALAVELNTTSLLAAEQQTKASVAVEVFKETLATSGPAVVAVVPAQPALVQEPQAGVRLVVQVVPESPTALPEPLRVTQAVAEAGTHPQLQT